MVVAEVVTVVAAVAVVVLAVQVVLVAVAGAQASHHHQASVDRHQ